MAQACKKPKLKIKKGDKVVVLTGKDRGTTGEILRAIAASPTDIRPVLQVVVETAGRLCDAYDVALVLREGDFLRFGAHHGPIPVDFEKLPIGRDWVTGRAVADSVAVQVPDLLAAGEAVLVRKNREHRLAQ